MIEHLRFDLSVERRQVVCSAQLEGEPIPWMRTGHGRRGQIYTPARYRDHRTALAWSMLEGRMLRAPLAVPIGLWCTFYRSSRRAVDLDNLLKAVGDAGTGIVWGDDAQITLLLGRLEVDRELPRTEIVAYRRELPVETVGEVP